MHIKSSAVAVALLASSASASAGWPAHTTKSNGMTVTQTVSQTVTDCGSNPHCPFHSKSEHTTETAAPTSSGGASSSSAPAPAPATSSGGASPSGGGKGEGEGGKKPTSSVPLIHPQKPSITVPASSSGSASASASASATPSHGQGGGNGGGNGGGQGGGENEGANPSSTAALSNPGSKVGVPVKGLGVVVAGILGGLAFLG